MRFGWEEEGSNRERESMSNDQELAQKFGMNFFECSAKTGTNVMEAVEFLTKDIMNKFASKQFVPKTKDPLKLGGADKIEQEGKGG